MGYRGGGLYGVLIYWIEGYTNVETGCFSSGTSPFRVFPYYEIGLYERIVEGDVEYIRIRLINIHHIKFTHKYGYLGKVGHFILFFTSVG